MKFLNYGVIWLDGGLPVQILKTSDGNFVVPVTGTMYPFDNLDDAFEFAEFASEHVVATDVPF